MITKPKFGLFQHARHLIDVLCMSSAVVLI